MVLTHYIPLIVSIVALTGVIFNTINNSKLSKRNKYLDVVTAQRLLWIAKLREQSSLAIDNLRFLQRNCLNIHINEKTLQYSDSINDRLNSLIKCLIDLSFMLNPKDDRKLLKRIQSVIKKVTSSPDTLWINTFIIERTRLELQIMLKREWEKVKSESRGG